MKFIHRRAILDVLQLYEPTCHCLDCGAKDCPEFSDAETRSQAQKPACKDLEPNDQDRVIGFRPRTLCFLSGSVRALPELWYSDGNRIKVIFEMEAGYGDAVGF
ncbi:hypothetical protein AUQ39_11790 [Lacticaseibacillus casei]|nr:hypothetical protein AUQ39_11790 [Lacticaseibacillus casei]